MTDYESHGFKHLDESFVADSSNPREEMDKASIADKEKLAYINAILPKLERELKEMGQADSTNYGQAEIDKLVELQDKVNDFTAMRTELESMLEVPKNQDEIIQDLGEIS